MTWNCNLKLSVIECLRVDIFPWVKSVDCLIKKYFKTVGVKLEQFRLMNHPEKKYIDFNSIRFYIHLYILVSMIVISEHLMSRSKSVIIRHRKVSWKVIAATMHYEYTVNIFFKYFSLSFAFPHVFWNIRGAYSHLLAMIPLSVIIICRDLFDFALSLTLNKCGGHFLQHSLRESSTSFTTDFRMVEGMERN